MTKLIFKQLSLVLTIALCTQPLLGTDNFQELGQGNRQPHQQFYTPPVSEEDPACKQLKILHQKITADISAHISRTEFVSLILNESVKMLEEQFPKDIIRLISIIYLGCFSGNYELNLKYSGLTDKQLHEFPYVRFLTGLTPNEMITNGGIKKLTNLISLDLSSNYEITDDGIKGLTNLTRLKLDRNRITDEGIKGLTKLTSLELCEVRNITNKGINYLPNLINLGLSFYSRITDDGIKMFTNLISLKLERNYEITDNGIMELRNLTSLDLTGNNKITNKGVKELTKLISLNLTGNNKITNDILKSLVNLTSLNLSENNMITNSGIKYLVNLTSLDLSMNNMITDAGIKNLVNLTSLYLWGNDTITNVLLQQRGFVKTDKLGGFTHLASSVKSSFSRFLNRLRLH